MKTVLAIAALAVSVAAITSCSTKAGSPDATAADISDRAMAEEIALSVDGRDFSTVAHPDDYIAAVADQVRNTCDILASFRRMDLLPDAPTDISKDAFEKLLQRMTGQTGRSWASERNGLYLSAKYRCPELSTAVGTHLSADAVNTPGR